MTKAAAQLLGEVLHDLTAKEGTAVLSGMQRTSTIWASIKEWIAVDDPQIKTFSLLDEAIEWAEDQLIYRYGGWQETTRVSLGDQLLLAGLTREELEELSATSHSPNIPERTTYCRCGRACRFFAFSAKRHGQREASKRHPSCHAVTRNGVWRDGTDRTKEDGGRVGRHSSSVTGIVA